MMDKKDMMLVQESRNCHDCLCWHKHCGAECCRIVKILNMANADLSGKFIQINCKLSPDMVWYYHLRGLLYRNGRLRVPTKNCEAIGPDLYLFKECSLLEGNLCKGHPHRKPKICRELTVETARDIKRGVVTPNCLFRYKLMEENQDG